MRKLLPLLLLIIFAACGEKGNSEKSESDTAIENLAYTVDTLVVDPGEDILFVNNLVVSPDRKTLFNFNSTKSELDVIDLDGLVVRNRISLEKEGPLGIGKSPRGIQVTDTDELFFFDFSGLRKLNEDKDSLTVFQFKKIQFGGDSLAENEELKSSLLVSTDGGKYFVPYGEQDFQKANTGLAIVELGTMELKKVPLDLFERSNQYVRKWIENGNIQSQSMETLDFYQIKNNLIISSHNFNEAFLYDITTDSLTRKVFNSELTPNAKKVSERTTGNSFEEMIEMADEAQKQVEFGTFLYDDKSEKVFRFTTDLDRMIGDPATFKNVITIFDSDLNQLHEEVVDFKRPGFSFFKDGKLYSYINVEDELGFAIFTFTF